MHDGKRGKSVDAIFMNEGHGQCLHTCAKEGRTKGAFKAQGRDTCCPTSSQQTIGSKQKPHTVDGRQESHVLL